MSWMNFFGSSPSTSSKPNVPVPTALQQQRVKQIETLRTFHHNVTEVQRDVEYRVTFSVAGTMTVFLNVTLPPNFPNDKPVVKVSPPLQHPWVNEQMVVVGCPALNSFYMHSSLGKAIQEVVRDFCERPPQLLGQGGISQVPWEFDNRDNNELQVSVKPLSGSSVPSYQPSPSYSYPGYRPLTTPFSSSPPRGSVGSFGHVPHLQFSQAEESAIASSRKSDSQLDFFQDLKSLSLERLKELNDNSEALEDFELSLELVKKIREDKEKIMTEIEKLARANVAKQPELESCKDDIIQKYGKVSDLKREFALKCQKQQEFTQCYSLMAIHTNMELAAAEAEEESEKIADDFLRRKSNIDEFLQQFVEKRKVCHLRRAKEEKLRNLHTRY